MWLGGAERGRDPLVVDVEAGFALAVEGDNRDRRAHAGHEGERLGADALRRQPVREPVAEGVVADPADELGRGPRARHGHRDVRKGATEAGPEAVRFGG
jgi:hypothetical protein